MKKIILLFLIFPALCLGAPVKKWNPGHYFEVRSNLGIAELQKAIAVPGIKGLLLRIQWREIEVSPNVFDFTFVDSRVNPIKAAGKSVGLILEDKRFNAMPGQNPNCVPDDMTTNSIYSGGQEIMGPVTGRRNCHPKRWVSTVADRWQVLIRKVGAKYDSDPKIVLIQSAESAGSPQTANPTQQQIYDFQLKQALAFSQAFPTTPWVLNLNWQLRDIPLQIKLMDKLVELGGGITHPDTVPPRGLPDIFETYFTTYKNRIVSAPLVELSFITGGQGADRGFGHIVRDKKDCWGHPCTWADIYTYATENLNAHFIGWPYFGWLVDGDQYFFDRDLAPVLKAKNYAINTSCPSNISCQSSVKPPVPLPPLNVKLKAN